MSNPQNQSQGSNQSLGGGFARTTFPCTINAADPAALTDGFVSQLSIDATGRLRVVLAGAAPVTTIAVQPVQTGDTIAPNSTRTVAPGAGTVLITNTPAAGTYIIDVLVNYDGAVAAAEINNIEVRRGGVAFHSPIIIPSIANVIQRYQYRIALSGAQAFDVRNIGAGTAGVGYNVAYFANRLV
jgi:hypothetical protein